ncbi:Protein of unknown function [Gryllus bimaculatus]|nr:Protein of unknown function [Gryllus bimaculatus]
MHRAVAKCLWQTSLEPVNARASYKIYFTQALARMCSPAARRRRRVAQRHALQRHARRQRRVGQLGGGAEHARDAQRAHALHAQRRRGAQQQPLAHARHLPRAPAAAAAPLAATHARGAPFRWRAGRGGGGDLPQPNGEIRRRPKRRLASPQLAQALSTRLRSRACKGHDRTRKRKERLRAIRCPFVTALLRYSPGM